MGCTVTALPSSRGPAICQMKIKKHGQAELGPKDKSIHPVIGHPYSLEQMDSKIHPAYRAIYARDFWYHDDSLPT